MSAGYATATLWPVPKPSALRETGACQRGSGLLRLLLHCVSSCCPAPSQQHLPGGNARIMLPGCCAEQLIASPCAAPSSSLHSSRTMSGKCVGVKYALHE